MFYDVREFNQEFVTEIKNMLIRELIETYPSCIYKDIEHNKNKWGLETDRQNILFFKVKYKNSEKSNIKNENNKDIIIRNFEVIIRLSKLSNIRLEKLAEKLAIDKNVFGKNIDVYEGINFLSNDPYFYELNFEILYCEYFDILDKNFNLVDVQITKTKNDLLKILKEELISCFNAVSEIKIINETDNFKEIIQHLQQFKENRTGDLSYSKFEKEVNNTQYLKIIFPIIMKADKLNISKFLDKLDMIISTACHNKVYLLTQLEKDKNKLIF